MLRIRRIAGGFRRLLDILVVDAEIKPEQQQHSSVEGGGFDDGNSVEFWMGNLDEIVSRRRVVNYGMINEKCVCVCVWLP